MVNLGCVLFPNKSANKSRHHTHTVYPFTQNETRLEHKRQQPPPYTLLPEKWQTQKQTHSLVPMAHHLNQIIYPMQRFGRGRHSIAKSEIRNYKAEQGLYSCFPLTMLLDIRGNASVLPWLTLNKTSKGMKLRALDKYTPTQLPDTVWKSLSLSPKLSETCVYTCIYIIVCLFVKCCRFSSLD